MQAPVEAYTSHAFFKGFQEGYLTMDTLASFVFGIIIINAIKEKVRKRKHKLWSFVQSDNNCGIYFSNYLYSSFLYGCFKCCKAWTFRNGGEVLAKVSNYYFGSYGGVLLGLMITVACLTTSVGLVSACSSFFHKLFPNVPYKAI